MNINQYAPKRIYENINSTINDLKEQSDNLHDVIKTIDSKCSNYQFITEGEIDAIINSIRNYFLIKESCLEQSKQILEVETLQSIEELNLKVKEHQNNSLQITGEILYYAYEFLKIKSTNLITDGLLQDHHEKLNIIISSTLNEFVDIEEISKKLEPYKIALLYITKQISDLTQYAEMMYNTFGAILFYNIVSGTNIEYDCNNKDVIEISNIVIEKPLEDTDITSELEPILISSDMVKTSINTKDFSEISLKEPIQEPIHNQLVSINDNIEDFPLETITPMETKENEIKTTSTTTENTENLSIQEFIEENTMLTAESEENPFLEDSFTNQSKSDIAELDIIEPIEMQDSAYNDDIDYFENLSILINNKYLETTNIQCTNDANFTESQAINNFCNYVLLKQFACASMVLKEYSKNSIEIESLYNQYGVAIGDPCVNCDYSVAFISIVDEQLHLWLELSALFREMFTCKNKEVGCYNFAPYMNSLIKNAQNDVLTYIPNFTEVVEVFNEVGYNTNYIIGIKLFDEKNSITAKIKQQAYDMLTYCEKTIGLWNNHKTLVSASRNLFSANGGIVYTLIKEIYFDETNAMQDVKQYCCNFADENGQMLTGIYLESKIDSYLHEQLSIVNLKRNNCDTDVNVGYRNKFVNRFTNILKFLFSYIEKMNDFSINYINETNVEKYRDLKNTLINLFNTNYIELSKISNNKDISKVDRTGMICLAKTFKDIISYIDYENYSQNYFYCELLKTGYFLLDEMYIPYLNENVSSINGFEVATRISKHLNDIKYLNSWKYAIENNIKKNNIGNVKLIVSYLKDINQPIDGMDNYLTEIESIDYSIENASESFKIKLKALYFEEVIPNKDVYDSILNMESLVRNIIYDNHNYGFYDMFLNILTDYSIKISQEYYCIKNNIVDYIGQSIGYDNEYYTQITNNIDNCKYSISDELISMYFNGVEYPKMVIDSLQIKQYDEIFSNFIKFSKEYASELSSPNGYIFMNEFYNSHIKSIVLERFNGSYDCVKSDELIETWVKGQGKVNVIYDILTNIGFSIENSILIDTHNSKIVLSNSEKKNSNPYTIPERVVFLNGIYNISQADRHISNLNITEDTLIILDYALNTYEREHIVQSINKISNGNRIILVDRCVIMFLTTLSGNIRKLAFKVCSISSIANTFLCGSSFRTDYIKNFSQDKRCNFLFGREYFGKTFILNSVAEVLKSNLDNIVLLIDAYDDNMGTIDLILQECKNLDLKINPFKDWSTFETSMTRYLNKHPNKKVSILVDNAEKYLNYCLEDSNVISIGILKNLNIKFKDRFNFTMVADMCYEYVSYVKNMDLTYSILNPLSYDETAIMFEEYLNSCRISIEDSEVMLLLVSKTFGCPEMVRLIAKQISLTLNEEVGAFNETYMYPLTLDLVNKSLSNDEFMKMISPVFLSTIIGNKEKYSTVVPIVYAILYFLYEHSDCSTFTINDIQSVLSIFDLEANETLNVETVLNELKTLRLINSFNDTQYFLSHEVYKNYLGNKEFAFDMLDECTKIFTKEGVTQ